MKSQTTTRVLSDTLQTRKVAVMAIVLSSLLELAVVPHFAHAQNQGYTQQTQTQLLAPSGVTSSTLNPLQVALLHWYQSEIPYDPPNQASYTSAPGLNGWASYKVADGVTSHEAWGLACIASSSIQMWCSPEQSRRRRVRGYASTT
jgi:hypothetical protein